MVPKVEGAWDIHDVDRLLAQLEAKARLQSPILIHAILETAQGVVNVEEIATASPRMQGMSFGPADLAASRRMKTTRVGGGHPGYRVLTNPPTPRNPRRAGSRPAGPCTNHRPHGRRLCFARDPPFYGPFGDINYTAGGETQFRAAFEGCVGAGRSTRSARHREEGLQPAARRSPFAQEGSRGDPGRPRRPHDRRQDAGRRDLEAVQGDGRARRNARREGPGAGRGLRACSCAGRGMRR